MAEGNRSLLVLDDEPDARDLMRFIFEPRGYKVYTASDGEDALRLLREHRITVALVDLLMPSMSGPEFLERLTELPAERRPRILIHSARRPDEIRKETEGFDIHGILNKPFEIRDVTAIVDEACEANPFCSGNDD